MVDWGLMDWAGAGLWFLIGAVPLATGGWLLVLRLMMRERCVGTVVNSWSNPDGGEAPIVAITTARGAECEFMGGPDIGRFGTKLGGDVPVRYNAAKLPLTAMPPGEREGVATLGVRTASIDTLRGSWSGPGVLIAIGVLMLGSLAATVAAEPRDSGDRHALRVEREAVYISLGSSAIDLFRCAKRPCSMGVIARRLDAYDRARRIAVASPATSSAVRERIRALQHSLRDTRRSGAVSGAVTGPVDLLVAEISGEVADDIGVSADL